MTAGHIAVEPIGGSTKSTSPPARGRVVLVRVLAVLALVTVSFLPVFAAVDALSHVGDQPALEAPGSPEAEYGAAHPSEAVHIPAFVTMSIIAAAGLVGLVVDPRRAGSGTHVLGVAVAMLFAAIIAGDPNNQGGQGALVDPLMVATTLPGVAAGLVAAPWRQWTLGGTKPAHLMLLGVLALPLVWFGIDHALLQRNTWPPLADPHHQAHWLVMAQLSISIPLLTLGAALRGTGWRLASALAALGLLAVAIPSFVYREAASTLPFWSALLAIMWAATVLWATVREPHSIKPDR